MASDSCPSDAQLRDYLAGGGDATTRAALAHHTQSCASCQLSVGKLEAAALDERTSEVGPPRPTDTPVLPPGTRVGHFVIERNLGRGGMGDVYLAKDESLERMVALKLLRGESAIGPEGSGGPRARMLREAHAMALLGHPNVVTIYEVGQHEGQVFLAMELVDGGTLKAWLSSQQRTWQEIVRVFVEAGKGLAAAHAVGLVHRDFKPDNVLVSVDGRVRVTDFGVARRLDEALVPQAPVAAGPNDLSSPLTVEGTVVGTVAYMSPEQRLGKPVDARSDVYSFCFALFEALHGVRPTAVDVQSRMKTDVPAFIRDAVLDGLEADPEERTPSIDAVLWALEHPPVSRLRRLAPWVAAAAVVAAGTGFAWRASLGPCDRLDERLAQTWNEALREKLSTAASADPDGAQRWAFAEKVIDGYAQQWRTVATTACEVAKSPTGTQAALQLQLDCLDERLAALSTALGVVSTRNETKLRDSTIVIIEMLPNLATCADPRALSVVQRPAPAIAAKVEALRRRKWEASIETSAGRHAVAITQLENIVADAKALEYPPIQIEAMLGLASAHSLSGAFDKSIPIHKEVLALAEANRLDAPAVVAANELLAASSLKGATVAEIDALIESATKTVARAGNTLPARFGLEHSTAIAYSNTGRYVEAFEHVKKSVALQRQLRGADSLQEVLELNNYGAMADNIGDYETALGAWREAIDVEHRVLGRNRDSSMLVWANLCLTNAHLERWEDSARACEKMLEISTRRGENFYTVMVLAAHAAALGETGKRAEAEAALDRGLTLLEKFASKSGPDRDDALRLFILAAVSVDRRSLAIELADRLDANLAARLTPDSPAWVPSLFAIGKGRSLAGQHREAKASLEKGIQLTLANPKSSSEWTGVFQFQLAQELDAIGDHAAALDLARVAEADLATRPVLKAKLARVRRWLAARGPEDPAR